MDVDELELRDASHARTSPQIPLLVVPEQRLRCRTLCRLPRQPDLGAVQRVVIPPVLELLLDPAADLEVIVRRDRDVPGVEQLVDVGAEEDAVGERMLLHVAIVADVRRFERRNFFSFVVRTNAEMPPRKGHPVLIGTVDLVEVLSPSCFENGC